jgi:hypothetical protein
MTASVGHTPGPWIVNPFNAQVDCAVVSKLGDLLPVAQMLWPADERSEAETEANARLIAAAPDLLAASQYALEVLAPQKDDDFVWSAMSQLVRAIAKATGAA